jgi:hypothetical protein
MEALFVGVKKEQISEDCGTRASAGRNTVTKYLWLLAFCFLTLSPLVPGQEDDTTRKLWDTAFIDQPKRPGIASSPKRRYRIATPNVPPDRVVGDTVVGVTLWRLRPSRKTDTGERILVQEGAEAADWIPERVESNTRLGAGTRVRMSVEAARSGYLYVINREQYADGSLGEPYLIFPTTRTNEGNNAVRKGRIIEIPNQEDRPPFFTLKPSRSDQVSEVISVLVSPTPLDDLTIGASAQKLSVQQVAKWEQSWGGTVGRLEMLNGAGKSWTRQEKEAGADATRSMTQDEPAPQTLYYRPGAKSGEPVMVNVALRYRSAPGGRTRRR